MKAFTSRMRVGLSTIAPFLSNTVSILSMTVFRLCFSSDFICNKVPKDRFCKSPSIKAILGISPFSFGCPYSAIVAATFTEINDLPVPGLMELNTNTFGKPA